MVEYEILSLLLQPLNTQKWMKKVQQEWNILQENLPGLLDGNHNVYIDC